jgi:CRISPR-associated protein Cas1
MRLYVTEPSARLTLRDGVLRVLLEGRALSETPIVQVERLLCFGPVQLSGQAQQALLRSSIGVDFFTQAGRYLGTLSNGSDGQLFVQLAHHERWRNADFRLTTARAFVRHKVRAQLRLLAGRTPNASLEMQRLKHRLQQILERIETVESVESLLGHEGQAAAHYFEAFGGLLRPGLPWGGRSRRPPADAPNALLSFGYTLVGTELAGLLESSGLDTRLGFLHSFRYGRQSLGQDLLEEVRPGLVDAWVLALFNRQHVQLEHFEARDGGVYLTREGMKKVLPHYSQWLGRVTDPQSWRARLVARVDALRDAVLDGKHLSPPGWEE